MDVLGGALGGRGVVAAREAAMAGRGARSGVGVLDVDDGSAGVGDSTAVTDGCGESDCLDSKGLDDDDTSTGLSGSSDLGDTTSNGRAKSGVLVTTSTCLDTSSGRISNGRTSDASSARWLLGKVKLLPTTASCGLLTARDTVRAGSTTGFSCRRTFSSGLGGADESL
jgi:hypothetical protein